MLITIVIPVLNRIDLLERCVNSIDYDIENLIIINNGKENIIDFKNKYIKNMYCLNMPTNLGVATSWNLGIKSTPYSDGWIFLNSDAWFNPGALKVYLETLRLDNIQVVSEQITTPPWCCAWVGANVVEKIGLFCEGFHPAYFEDWDYERRAKFAGFEITVSQAEVNHQWSSTIQSNILFDLLNTTTFPANKILYESRNNTSDAGQWSLQRRLELSWDRDD
jgi:GT2 family glycosyltransferase